MNIIYIISCFKNTNSGVGGHYHSMIATATALSTQHAVQIVSIGNLIPKVLSKQSIPFKHVYFQLNKIKNSLREIREALLSADVIHCFDSDCFFWVRLLKIDQELPVILTKAGGPNPKRHFPKCDYLILYSQENLQWFRAKPKFLNTQIELIPNRVSLNPTHSNPYNETDTPLWPAYEQGIKIICIARINQSKIHQLIGSIEVLKEFITKGTKASLCIIGRVEEDAALRILESQIQDIPATILTGENFTNLASRFLIQADIAIGAGRGLMEASAASCVVFCSTRYQRLPIPFTSATAEILGVHNFSDRNTAHNEFGETFSAQYIARLIDPVFLNAQKLSSRNLYHQKFDITPVIGKYSDFYACAIPAVKTHCFDLLAHGFWFILRFLMPRKVIPAFFRTYK